MQDQSTFKTSTGDEAATKSQGMGVVTHTIQGEASFVTWSMDVKFEDACVDRHLDLMIHNEQSNPANTPTMAYVSQAATGSADKLKCGELGNYGEQKGRTGEGKYDRDHIPSKAALKERARRSSTPGWILVPLKPVPLTMALFQWSLPRQRISR